VVLDLAFAALGLVILLLSGDSLVRGAVALSLRLGIPVLIVSLTVVSFGTSAPELLISIQAALDGVPGIAVGNVVGSNIANVLMVLGVPALIASMDPKGCDCARSYYQMLAASVVLIALCFLGPLHFWHAAVLLALFALMLADAFAQGRNGGENLPEEFDASPGMPVWKMAAFIVVGLIGLPVGAQLLIDGAVGVSRELGVSEEVIGLTMVAIGTSLPELATTLMAAIRRQADVAIGNVIGSNLFNILGILGVASLFGPIPIDAAFLTRDLWVMLACALVLAPIVLGGRRIGKRWGIAFLGLYAVYIFTLFAQGGVSA
jgi:cation:H+ antiporter